MPNELTIKAILLYLFLGVTICTIVPWLIRAMLFWSHIWMYLLYIEKPVGFIHFVKRFTHYVNHINELPRSFDLTKNEQNAPDKP